MAFHPYPRVIPPVFNPGGFGPPRGLTPASACPRIAHPASRLRLTTERPVQTRFRFGLLRGLTSPPTVTRWLILQKARRHSCKNCSDCSEARGFRYYFTPLSGCFSPFPHGTGSLSVAGECSALEGGPPRFGPGSSCPALLGKKNMQPMGFRLRDFHPVSPAFPGRSAIAPVSYCTPDLELWHIFPRNTTKPAPPGCDGHSGLGIARVRSPLLAGSRLISLPPGT